MELEESMKSKSYTGTRKEKRENKARHKRPASASKRRKEESPLKRQKGKR